MKIKILNKARDTIAVSNSGEKLVTLVYAASYEENDVISIEFNKSHLFVEVQLDDALKPAVLYVKNKSLYFKVPFKEERLTISPKAFSGSLHVITVRVLEEWEVLVRRNLALNPYAGFLSPTIYPVINANVETRNEAVFAARNAVDGIYANHSHGKYPYGSWGINQQDDAEWKIDFGTEVQVDELRLTLRADYPHDAYWSEAVLAFSDNSEEKVKLIKSDEPQSFYFEARKISTLTLKDLKKATSDSLFPALTQFEIYGNYIL